MSKDICFFREENGPRCKNPYFITFKVQIFHPKSLRRSWQTWKACKEHFERFIENPQNFYTWYPKRLNRPDAPVIGYKILY